LPVATPQEIAAIDEASGVTREILIDRAGAAVAKAALEILNDVEIPRIAVIVGKGSNGADGRVAARLLAKRGGMVEMFDACDTPENLFGIDLVIDAAYGTGLRGTYRAPVTDAPVLAVDLPSGLDALTGDSSGSPARATRTVTFGTLKFGHLLGVGPDYCGEVVVADIGLEVSGIRASLVEPSDIAWMVPIRPRDHHKWQSACWVVAGSSGMEGSAHLAARAAQRAGAGYVRLSVPAGLRMLQAPLEVVVDSISGNLDLPEDHERFSSLVLGPGLGRVSGDDVRSLLTRFSGPVVVDGDGLSALGVLAKPLREMPTILTPHDGEFERLTGSRPGPNRVDKASELAERSGAVVLLKGSTTIIATPGGEVILSASGDQRLATAGSGDVLSGIIGAFLARGAHPTEAAAAGAFVHGLTVADLPHTGVVAGDLDRCLPNILSELLGKAEAEVGV